MRKIKRTWQTYSSNCSRCKGPNDPYMVTFELWKKIIGPIHSGMVCLECFELALGRELQREDFIDAPINHGIFGFDVEEFLKSRK